jgi:hypothetical protein
VKDSQLKDLLFKHHWVQRHFAQPEVEIYVPGGTGEADRMITDIDVLSFRPSKELSFERLLGDCKTLKAVSPVNRALWMSGLMSFVNARSGTVLLKVEHIEQDHRIAAARVGVSLFSQHDFLTYDKAINYPMGSEHSAVSAQDVRDLAGANKKYDGLSDLLQYLARDAWQEPAPRLLIRHTLGALSDASGELDPAKPEHLALVADVAAVFSIGLAECAGRIFHQFLQPSQKTLLADVLLRFLWGGREGVQFYRAVKQQVAPGNDAHGEEATGLELPEWGGFIQLVRNMLEQPPAAFEVPWLLRHFAIDLFRARKPLKFAESRDLFSLKQAMLAVGYLCKAAGLPREFNVNLVGELVSIQSALVAPSDGAVVAETPGT